jgi:hypothetical protein
MSNTINPSLSQGQLLEFNKMFHSLSQQRTSKLSNAGVINFLPIGGKEMNYGRIGSLDLVKTNERNPDHQFSEYSLDNRKLSQQRYTRTVMLDEKFDIMELITDPTSPIMQELVNAEQRLRDKVAIEAAVGPVRMGDPGGADTLVSAANDGVITIDATSSGFVYSTYTKMIENFVNNNVDTMSGIIAVSGSEHTDLMGEDKFINNDYTQARPVDSGSVANLSGWQVAKFAGSVNGGIQVAKPILPEGSTNRTNVVLTPGSIAMRHTIEKLEVVDFKETKVNSKGVVISVLSEAMRTEGAKVQLVTTTI